MKHMIERVGLRDNKIEFMRSYKIASKYFWVGMDLKCENVTLISVPIVKCMGK